MKLLIVAATAAEIHPLLAHFPFDGKSLKINSHDIDVLVTDVGMVPTAFALGCLSHQQYDLAINLGIAGSFDRNLVVGEVVLVNQDVFAEWGAEDDQEFLSIDILGFGECVQYATGLSFLKNLNIREVRGITVNKVHGNELSIAKTMARLSPQVESMEGAAFFYACNKNLTKCVQVRAISNHVERRSRDKWNIELAIKNLNDFAIQLLTTLL